MHEVLARIRARPLFRAAIAAPVAVMIVFSLFNLTGATDPARIPQAVTLGIVNLDTGIPTGPRFSDQLLAGFTRVLPFRTAAFDTEEAARGALAAGDVSAVLILPADFSQAVLGSQPVGARVITTQHLSVAEAQLGSSLGGQIGAALTAGISGIRLAAAQGVAPGAAPVPPLAMATETLYAASSSAALAAPFVMTFATWLASLIGAMMLFIATWPERSPGSLVPVALVRSLLPLVAPALAALALALVVATALGTWSIFLSLWLTIWIAIAALTLLIAGLFAVFGFLTVAVVLPVVFYQGALSGAQAPVAAAPEWLRSIGEALPFDRLAIAYRSLVIGGPETAIPIGLLLMVAAIGLALIWVGTWFHRRVWRRERAVAA